MAKNKVRWIANILGAKSPWIMKGLFQAGSVQVVKRGELLELTGDSNTRWVPMDSDFAMDKNVCLANEEIKDGDRAGYYEIIVPRPGDIFEFALDAAGDPAVGAALYWDSSEQVSESGTNILGHAVGQDHYPLKQGHLADDNSPNHGEVIRNTSYVQMTIEKSNSFYLALQAE